jgi:hypothetical protein
MKTESKKVIESDIIKMILRDHKPLKEHIEILKDADVPMSRKKPVFEKFAPLLLQHAKAEEESLYIHMKENKKELRIEGLEGDTEHAIADHLIQEIKGLINNPDAWMAKVKVLADVVDHHLKEEEKEYFKTIKEEIGLEERSMIAQEYGILLEEHRLERDQKPSIIEADIELEISDPDFLEDEYHPQL